MTRILEQDRIILNDNNRVAELRVHFQLEQDRLVQTHDICTAELISDLHKMTLKYRKERGMFDVVRKSKDAVIANLKQEHSDEIIKIKKEDDTIRYNLEKENTIIKALQYNVHALHLEELKKRDKAMRDKDKQFQGAKEHRSFGSCVSACYVSRWHSGEGIHRGEDRRDTLEGYRA